MYNNKHKNSYVSIYNCFTFDFKIDKPLQSYMIGTM